MYVGAHAKLPATIGLSASSYGRARAAGKHGRRSLLENYHPWDVTAMLFPVGPKKRKGSPTEFFAVDLSIPDKIP